MDVIRISHLTKYYGKARGIIDVSFEVREGEIFGFIGPNGAGKSTTIRTLLGLIHPTGGSASIFGMDCLKQGHVVRRRIGYMPSEVFYYDGMKVIDLLKYSAAFYPGTDPKRISALAEIMDLDLTKKIEDLSYGNKKKVGILQGLIHQPELIILDEPTSGLDPLMQQSFFQLIREENKRGATVLFSSHILGEVQKMCTRVGIIKEGRMIKIEDIDTLKQSNYKKFRMEFPGEVTVDFRPLPGVTNLSAGDTRIDFLYGGDINRIIDLLHGHPIANLTVEEPTLEEIFLHYYEKEA